ncbi:MAG: DUF192 domain-containing protein [Acidimicrobiia bacterium]
MTRVPVPSTRTLQWLIVGLLVAGFVSFVVKGADQPADPFLRVASRQPVEGYGEIAYRVNRTAQATRCAILAQSAMQQSRGLYGRSDLAGYDGLMFFFPADVTAGVPTRNTGLALSTAFFDSGGRFLTAVDSEPCDDRADCPAPAPPGPYRYALQVARGALPSLGIEEGAVLSVGGPCP